MACLVLGHASRSQEILKLYQTIKVEDEFEKKRVSSLTFSADGKYILMSAGQEVKIWEVFGWSLKRAYVKKDYSYFSETPHKVQFSPDGSEIAYSAYDMKGVKRINWMDDDKLKTIKTKRDNVEFYYSPDGTQMLVCQDGIGIYDLASTKQVTLLGDKKSFYYTAAFDPSGEFIAGSLSNSTEIYRIKDGKTVSSIPERGFASCFDVGGSKIYFMNYGGEVSEWDTDTGVKIKDIQTNYSTSTFCEDSQPMAMTPNNKYLIIPTKGKGSGIKYPTPLYNTNTEEYDTTPISKKDDFITQMALSADGRFLAIQRYDGYSYVEVWKFTTPQK